MSEIPDDVMAQVSSELDELVNAYVFSANFDGDARDEMQAIRNWAANAILAERERCANVCFRLAGGDDFRDDEYSLEAVCGRTILAGEQPPRGEE